MSSADERRAPTQNERILALLADGRWHTTREILQAVPCIVHSRIAEINGRPGFTIEHEGAGGGAENHRYRLVAVPRDASPQNGSERVVLDTVGAAEVAGPVSLASQGTAIDEPIPGQLSIDEVAA